MGDDEQVVDVKDVEVGGAALAIAAGRGHTCVVMAGGRVRCWGPWHELGRLRKVPPSTRPPLRVLPEDVDFGAPVAQLVTGDGHFCVLTNKASVRCRGHDGEGQLGEGPGAPNQVKTTDQPSGDVALGGRVKNLWAGRNGTCALVEDGTLKCWGEPWVHHPHTQRDRVARRATPTAIDLGGPVKQVVFGMAHSCALLDEGTIHCWGSGFGGVLGYTKGEDIGDDEAPGSVGPVDVGGRAVALAAGAAHTCALLETGSLRCWGTAEGGRLGYGNGLDIGDDETPAKAGDVPVGEKVVQVAAGGWHTCAVLATGGVRCWGTGDDGKLGYGNTASVGERDTPADVGDVPFFKKRPPAPKRERAAQPATLPFDWTEEEPAPNRAPCAAGCPGCRLLFDSRKFNPNPKRKELTPAEQASVAAVYEQYLRSDRCQDDEIHLDPLAIGSPQDNGRLSDVVSGSFTEPGRRQKLVLYFAGHCGKQGFHAEHWGQRLIVLLEDEKVVTAMVDAATSLFSVTDIDADGRDEVLAWGGWAGAGGAYSWLTLQSYAGGERRALAHFDPIDSDTCSFPPGTRSESTLRYRWDKPKQSLCLEQQTRSLPCPKQ